jgi:hypothetical protein
MKRRLTMKHLNTKRTHSMLLACCLAAAGVTAAHAGDTTETTTTSTTTTTTAPTTTAVGTSTHTESKLSAEFAYFLGGQDQASTVVSGLRQGTAFSLDTETTATGTTGTTTSTTTIDPPTGTMGYGNIRIALRLAQAQLGDLVITQPTADQLSAVLVGGTINGTQFDGILTLRADGMGWGQIAQQYGTTVGQLMGKGSVHATLLPSESAGKAPSPAGSTGKITGSTKVHANGYIPSGKGLGDGFVTAAGNTVNASGMGGGKGQNRQLGVNAHGAGATSAGGQHVSMAGASNAGGGSSATAPGQAKKN